MKKLSTFICFFFFTAILAAQDSLYNLGPDSQRKEGVPKGIVTAYEWESSIYQNFRNYYVYVPAQYDSSKPAALMIFQDGYAYLREDGDFRVPIVLDNLIAKKEIPVIIAVFINPGHSSKNYPENFFRSSNRSVEYDEMSDRYVRFLTEELLPSLQKKYNLSNEPSMHAIGGLSSGGICAFTAAWQRPNYFQKVMSHVGSFTDIKGGHAYPSIIRKATKKDIKVFLQDGTNDLDNEYGNWWLANLQMEAALQFKHYNFKFEKGTGAHSGKHGGAILPESLKWLWNDIKNY